MSRSLKKLILLIPAIILIAAACNNQAAVQPAPAPTPVTQNSTDATANWKTYTNAQYGFTFQYPSNLTSLKTTESSINGGNQIYVTYSDPNYKYSSPEHAFDFSLTMQSYNEARTPENYFTASIFSQGQKETINGNQAFNFSADGAGGRTLYIFNGKSVAVFVLGEGSLTTSDFNKIASTFKFTK